MAYGAEPVGADTLAHTIHIWPSRELVARSWSWSEAWHAAYEDAASQIGRAVAVCVLGGLAVTEQPIEMELPFGYVSFSVSLWGTSIDISITAFEGPSGPDAPGPDGGHRQPRPADGLVLGLRGTGKCFALVTFYGYLPPLPAGCFFSGTKQRNDAGLAEIVAHARNSGQGRAAMAVRSGITLAPHLVSVGKAQSLSEAVEEMLRDAGSHAPRGSWIAEDDSDGSLVPGNSTPIGWSNPTEISPLERSHFSYLH